MAIRALSWSMWRLRRRMCAMRSRATSARVVVSPRSSLEAASSPLGLLRAPVRVCYRQRIFSRALWRRLMAAVRSLTSSRR